MIPDHVREALSHAVGTLSTVAPDQRQGVLNYINNLLDWINSRKSRNGQRW